MAPLRQVVAAALALFAVSAAVESTATTDVELDTSRSNTGALTTTFTPDPTCLSEIETRINRPGGYPALELGCEGPGGNQCCPPRWGGNRYFSPGVCPEGYQACALPTTRQREETTRMCCPEYVRPAAHGPCNDDNVPNLDKITDQGNLHTGTLIVQQGHTTTTCAKAPSTA